MPEMDFERELARRLAALDIETNTALLAKAEADAERALRWAHEVRTTLAAARSRHDRIADGGPIEDEA